MKKNFSIRALPELPKPPPPPNSGNFTDFFPADKNDILRVWRKNDDNNCCHDNFDQNFGNFDDNDDKKYWKNLQILLILGKILPFRDY